jgi:NAD(P)-dependent dehydrogenase (short-subunit alcohol dehydrogenase family)
VTKIVFQLPCAFEYRNRMNLQGKGALITGGTKGIGAACALAFARAGAAVVINGRNDDSDAQQTLQAIRELGGKGHLLLADCAKPAESTQLVEEAAKLLGRLDVLMHSAGGPVNGHLMQITPEHWHAAFDVHVHAIYYLCRAAIPHMRSAKEGAVLLVSSTAGIRGIVTNAAYQAAKGAIPQITRALAREFAGENIRVNCVAPGVIRTAFHNEMTEAQRRLNLDQRIPLRREGNPAQVASVVLELATNDYITGETVVVDGGLTMRVA